MLVVLVLLILTTGLALIPSVQTSITSTIIKRVNRQYGIEVALGRTQIIPIQLKTQLGELLILDHQKDTLFYVDEVSTSIAEFSTLFEGSFDLSSYKLEGVEANIVKYPQDSLTNLDIWLSKLKNPTTTDNFRFEAQNVIAENLKFKLVDSTSNTTMSLERLELKNLIIEDQNVFAQYVALDNGEFDNFSLSSSTFAVSFENDDLLLNNLYLRTALSELSIYELGIADVSKTAENPKIKFDIAPSFVTFNEFEGLVSNKTLLNLRNSLFFEGTGLYSDGEIEVSKTKIQYLDSYFEGALYV